MAQKQVFILNTRVDSTRRLELLANIGKKMASRLGKDKFYIVTPNPEIVLAANQDKKLQSIINKADFSVPDGIGLKLFGNSKLKIIHGRKLVTDLLNIANKRSAKVFFITSDVLNSREGLLKFVRLNYSNIDAQAYVGPRLDLDGKSTTKLEAKIEKDLIVKINKFKPHLLFVCFGASKQEKWIAKWLSKLNVKGAMGVGGSLDYLAGTKPLPPRLMEKLELEWMWRLFVEKGHFKRVINAVFVFPFVVLINRFKS